MATINHYGISAVKFSGTTQHHRYITHVFIHAVSENGVKAPGQLYTKDAAIKLMANTPIYTFVWNYSNPGKWIKSALVGTEVVDGITYLRSHKDNTTADNLANLIDFDYFNI